MPESVQTSSEHGSSAVQTDSGSPATDFSFALLGEFIRLGVTDIVVSPGSRSQALALAAAEFERVGAVRLHVRIDERSAGFFALGLAVESGMPALVITTSGTAVANLHPAVLEAHHSYVPMILLTADRPDELRGIRANQTTIQPGIYADATRLALDVPAPTGAVGDVPEAARLAELALGAALAPGLPGPVQLNLAFREPLSAAVQLDPSVVGAARAGAATADPAATADVPAHPLIVEPGKRTVVIAGADAGAEAEEIARAGGWPLLAEVSSGARFGPNLVIAYRELLDEPEWGGQIERAIVFGHPTLSRQVPALIQRDGVETIVVSPAGAEHYNPGHSVDHVAERVSVSDAARGDALAREARAWTGRWVMASRQIRDAIDEAENAAPDVAAASSPDYRVRGGFAKSELAALRAPVTRGILVDALWRATWPHDRLVFGASRLIRVADQRVPGKKISVHANRGLAGIDGTIATAVGIAVASQSGDEPLSTGTTRVIVGDLTLLHDVGSLLQVPGESRPRLQIVVGNDGGGTIFDGLEVAASAPASAMDRVLFTPQQVDIAALAQAYGWEYTLATNRSELERALTSPQSGPSILEVPLPR
ncbi:2-succinyl-5-enolpyruvyl-6-hydroxy-3-cyclohexene-1-carboxylic-acid synthase [Leifsonia sp. A12D58]|uniref:2-succinyl-5-enolpyruvyl-6-hydroxy-3- cyclohexene-1-carboxylic-acid synthase n=1 Tax=Leifsonia sp. A12D58 TaxID=3397674 RepID=UPI0039E067E7